VLAVASAQLRYWLRNLWVLDKGFAKLEIDGRSRYGWKRRNWKRVKVRSVEPLIRGVRSVCQSN